ncbi:hypothetical protein CU097_012375 [Rhizopus azygosporus]|uniref:Uncharacterized protein n=1 Tax=Rhizopus azygosporus TaxID=86630 RepID=A0A367K5C3_RHIAZ|nr:hypothetical protein CU097_012375 [Rhizopus azygosporus]
MIDISRISFPNDLQLAISVVKHLSDTLKSIYVTEDQSELIKVTLNFFQRGISVFVTRNRGEKRFADESSSREYPKDFE